MTPANRLSFWIMTSSKREASTRPAHASAARSAVGRPAKKTDGLVAAGTIGALSIQEGCAPPASISGRKPSALLAADGRRIRTGMRSNLDFVVSNF